MSGQKKLFNKSIKLIYKDIENSESENPSRNIPKRHENVTPVDEDGIVGITLRVKGYFCKNRRWDSGLDFFYKTLNGEVLKPEVFTSAHPDIGKKRILEKLKIDVEDFLIYGTTRKFLRYNLFKIDHQKYNSGRKWESWTKDILLQNNITDMITTKFDDKSLEFLELDYKLNAYEDLVILPDFDISQNNSDGYYKNAKSKWVMVCSKPYALLNVSGTYKFTY